MRTSWSKLLVALGVAALCLVTLSALEAPLLAQGCKTPINTTKNCTGPGGCTGQYESGYCGAPETNLMECRAFYTPCCGHNYVFAENDLSCPLAAACGKAPESTMGRLVYLAPVGKSHRRRVAVVSAVRSRGGSVVLGPAFRGAGMF